MSPIYVRPAREQSEHDRLIRHLQSKYQKKFEIAVNIDGVDPPTPVKFGVATLFPDIILVAGKKLLGFVEVETGESINNLEVMAQWVHFGAARVPFHLYVPVQGYEAARRLCDAYRVRPTEIWTYRPLTEGFDLVRMHNDPAAVSASRSFSKTAMLVPPPPPPKPPVPVPPPVSVKPTPASAKVAKAVATAKAVKPAKPVKPVAPLPAPPKVGKPAAGKPVAKAPAPKASAPKAAVPKAAKLPAKAAKPAKARKPAPRPKKGPARKRR